MRSAWIIGLAVALATMTGSVLAGDADETFAAMERVAARDLPALDRTGWGQRGGDLGSCGGFAMALGISRSDPAFEAIDVAGWSVRLRHEIASLGLGEVAAVDIANMEALGVAMLKRGGISGALSSKQTAILARTIRDLNAGVAARRIHVERYIDDRGCGAGDLFYKLLPSKPVQYLFVIPAFFYELCRAQPQYDADMPRTPAAPNGCGWWRDAKHTELDGSGKYFYRATWLDGHATSGTYTISDFALGKMTNGKLNLLTIPIDD